MKAAVAVPRAERLDRLLAALDDAGWDIGLEQRRQAASLVLHATSGDPGGPSDDELVRMLRPVMCASLGEQEAFADHARRAWASPPRERAGGAREPPPQPLDETLERSERAARIATVAILVLALVAVGVAGAVLDDPAPTTTSVAPAPTTTGGATATTATGPTTTATTRPTGGSAPTTSDRPPPPPGTVRRSRVVPVVLGVVAAAGLAIAGVWTFRARLFIRRRRARGPLDTLVAALPSRPPITEEVATRLTRAMRRPAATDDHVIDVGASVRATARAGGHRVLAFSARYRRPEFVVLVERRGHRDALAAWHLAVFAELAARDVAAEVCEFNSSARRCRVGRTGDTVDLAALNGATNDRTLLVACDPATLADSVSGRPYGWVDDLHHWPRTVLLDDHGTPADLGFDLAASYHHLAGLIDTPQANGQVRIRPLPASLRRHAGAWLGPVPMEPAETLRMLDTLQLRLGADGYLWLAACAAYPEMSYDLTRLLGEALVAADGDAVADHVEIRELLRLPWLRAGYMPDWLRGTILGTLPPERLARVRFAVEAVLTAAQQPDAVPEGRTLLRLARSHQGALQRLWSAVGRTEEALAGDPVLVDVVRGRAPRLGIAMPRELLSRLRYRGAAAEPADRTHADLPAPRVRRFLVVADMLVLLLAAFLIAMTATGRPDVLWAGWLLGSPAVGLSAGMALAAGARRSLAISLGVAGAWVASLALLLVSGRFSSFAFLVWESFFSGDRLAIADRLILGVPLGAAVGWAALRHRRGNEAAVPWGEFVRRARRVARRAWVVMAAAAVVSASALAFARSDAVRLAGFACFVVANGAAVAWLAPSYATSLRIGWFLGLVVLAWIGTGAAGVSLIVAAVVLPISAVVLLGVCRGLRRGGDRGPLVPWFTVRLHRRFGLLPAALGGALFTNAFLPWLHGDTLFGRVRGYTAWAAVDFGVDPRPQIGTLLAIGAAALMLLAAVVARRAWAARLVELSVVVAALAAFTLVSLLASPKLSFALYAYWLGLGGVVAMVALAVAFRIRLARERRS